MALRRRCRRSCVAAVDFHAQLTPDFRRHVTRTGRYQPLGYTAEYQYMTGSARNEKLGQLAVKINMSYAPGVVSLLHTNTLNDRRLRDICGPLEIGRASCRER